MVALMVILAAASATPAVAANPPPAPAVSAAPTVLVIPFARQGPAPEWASIAFADTFVDMVARAGRDNFLTLKQVDAVLRRRDIVLADAADPEVGAELSRALGATDIVTGDVKVDGDKWVVEARRLAAKEKKVVRSARREGTRDDLPGMAAALAWELLDVGTPVGPPTLHPAAFERAAECLAHVARIPLGPRAPKKLAVASPAEAEAACRGAVTLDPGLASARAGLAIVLGARGDTKGALEEVRTARRDGFAPLAVLAESQLQRLAGDGAGALATLEAAARKHPGFLHALGYLGEAYIDAKKNADAIAVMDRYLARSPDHPWALALKAKALMRAGRLDESIAATRRSLEVAPDDPELLVELGSRLIDARRDAEAEAPLREALQARPIRPAVYLRLGFLELRRRQLKEAREHLEVALREAWREDEWRVRGYAQEDLARVAALENRDDDAVVHLEAAAAEGVRAHLPCRVPELRRLAGRPDFDRLCPGVGK